MSIRGRLMGSLAVAIAVVVSASALVAYARLRVRLYRELDRELALEAREMLEVAQHDSGGLGFGQRSGMLADFERVESSCYYEFLAPDGTVVMRSGNLGGAAILRPDDAGDDGFATVIPGGRAGHAVRVPVEPAEWAAFVSAHRDLVLSAEVPSEGATIVVATDPKDIEKILTELKLSLSLTALATIAIVTAVVGFVVRRALVPLERLSARAASIQPADLTVRFGGDHAPRELQPIQRCLDELLDRVEHAFARERRFNSAVAHELRTPVAELKTICEVALRGPVTAEEHEAAVRQSGEIATQMEALIGTLLTLRRAEAGAVALLNEEIDVAALVRHAFTQAKPKIAARKLALELVLPPSARLRSDRTLLSAIVANLVTNAVDHSPFEGRIRCTLDVAAGLRMDVANAAPDVAPEDLPRLFEPFWCKNAARSDNSHWGLGLALASAFAERLGLRLHATLDADRTLHFRLETADVPAITA